MRLLLVEDDLMIGESLRLALRQDGYAVDWVRDISAANSTLASERFDLVLWDLGLPEGGPQAQARTSPPLSGLSVLQALRARRDNTQGIVLTARDGPGERVLGLGSSLDQQRAFVADAAHELRSPLTALKLQAQLLQRAPDETGRDRTRQRDGRAAGRHSPRGPLG